MTTPLSHLNKSLCAFTLLELLVALVLMAVAAACLYSSLYTAFQAQRSAEAAIQPTTTAINVLSLVKGDLLGTLRPNGDLAGNFVGLDAKNDRGDASDSVSFYSTHALSNANPVTGGSRWIELTLVEPEDTDATASVLVRRVTTNLLASNSDTDAAVNQVLCRQVRSFNLRYFDGTRWVDEWDSATLDNSLPMAVEISIEIDYRRRGSSETAQGRRLVQRIPIPCGGDSAIDPLVMGVPAL